MGIYSLCHSFPYFLLRTSKSVSFPSIHSLKTAPSSNLQTMAIYITTLYRIPNCCIVEAVPNPKPSTLYIEAKKKGSGLGNWVRVLFYSSTHNDHQKEDTGKYMSYSQYRDRQWTWLPYSALYAELDERPYFSTTKRRSPCPLGKPNNHSRSYESPLRLYAQYVS